jgi:hypothetical protein
MSLSKKFITSALAEFIVSLRRLTQMLNAFYVQQKIVLQQ